MVGRPPKNIPLVGKNSNNIVYDPFMGTGTTAVACKRLGINCFGSEISKDQVDFSYERLKNT